MFGNNINNPFMMNNMYGPNMMGNAMMRTTPMFGNASIIGNNMLGAPRTGGLLSSLLGRGSSLGGFPKSFNFGTLLSNTSKALGVVKDAIPIVKEVGPMVGNMKQMLKIASIFKDETDTTNKSAKVETTSNTESNIISSKENDTNIISTTTNQNNNEPNFFL